MASVCALCAAYLDERPTLNDVAKYLDTKGWVYAFHSECMTAKIGVTGAIVVVQLY